MKNFKKNVSLILTVIMLSLSFGPTFTFAETGQIADKSEQPVTENAVAAPEKRSLLFQIQLTEQLSGKMLTNKSLRMAGQAQRVRPR